MLINLTTQANSILMALYTVNSNPYAPIEVNFKYLIKDADLRNMKMKDKIHRHSKDRKRIDDYKYHLLHSDFPKSVMKTNTTLRKPFLLIPMFRILDVDGEQLNHKLFKKGVYKQISTLPTNRTCYLAPNRKLLAYEKGLLLLTGKTKDIDIQNSIFAASGGYFFSQDHNSNFSMVYVAFFIDSSYIKEIEELYNHYILKNKSNDKKIIKGDVDIKLQWNILNLQKYKSLFIICNEPENTLRLEPDLPRKILESSNMELTIKLQGRKKANGDFTLVVNKYFDGKRVNDLFFKLNFCNYYAQVSYKSFKKELKKRNKKSDKFNKKA